MVSLYRFKMTIKRKGALYMSIREYKCWTIGAIFSAIIWLIMIFLQTISVLSALIGATVGCFTFYYWMRILPPDKNIRLCYVIGSFTAVFVNKIVGIQWFMAIFCSFSMLTAIMFVVLFVCTSKQISKGNSNNCLMWYRSNLRRKYK